MEFWKEKEMLAPHHSMTKEDFKKNKKKTLTKRQLVDVVAKIVGLTGKKTQEVVQVFLDSIASHLLEGSRLEFRDFGTFEPVVRQAKQGRDLQNNRPLEIPAYTTVKFTPGKKLQAGFSNGKKEA